MSIISIKNEFPTAELNIKVATVDQTNKIIKGLDAKKATGPDKIPEKVGLHIRQTSYNQKRLFKTLIFGLRTIFKKAQ